MNRDEVIKIMSLIAVEYGALFDVSEERVNLWCIQLQDVQRDDAGRAVMTMLGEDREFPPRIGEIRTAALSYQHRRAAVGGSGRSNVFQLPPPISDEERERNKEKFRRLIDERFPGLREKGMRKIGGPE